MIAITRWSRYNHKHMHRRNMAILKWNIVSWTWYIRLRRNMSRYWCTEKRNWQATRASLLQVTKRSVHTEAIINKIQIWRWCIFFTRNHANQNSYAELIVLEHQSEPRTRRYSAATRSQSLEQWETRGEQSSERATGSRSRLLSATHT